jgi:radical SAM protein with 4Fe4S-binding SPASM domain
MSTDFQLPAGAPPAFHVLAKPTGAVCNLNCTYCFFLSKQALYPGSRFRMSDEVLETSIRQLFAAHRTPEVTVAWQGGEPPGVCVFAETCGGALALEHTGDVYACDHYVAPDYKLGNIQETHRVDMLISPRQVAFGRAKRDTLPQSCRDCPVRFACHGSAPAIAS